jgi:hypothetical protein
MSRSSENKSTTSSSKDDPFLRTRPDIQISSDLTDDSDNITLPRIKMVPRLWIMAKTAKTNQHQSGSSMLDDHDRALQLQLQVDLDGEDSVQPVAKIYSDACPVLH